MSASNSLIGTIADEALVKHAEKWNTISCCNAPMDRDAVRESLDKMFAVVRCPPPKHVVFLQSPFTGAIASVILAKGALGESGQFATHHERVVRSFNDTLASNVWRIIGQRSSQDWWRQVESRLNQMLTGYGSVRTELVEAFRFTSGTTNEPIGMQTSFHEKTGGILSHVARELEASVPGKYLTHMIETTCQGLSHKLVAGAVTQAYRCGLGCHDASMPFYDFLRQSGFNLPELDGVLPLSESCGWWWPMGDVCIVTERPRFIHTDDQGHLHCGGGRAFEYTDSWGGYSWHGAFLPKRFIDFTGNMNVFDIVGEPNVELRRMMLDLFGAENFVLASGALPIQADECGTLYRLQLTGDEPLVMVAVTNSTPEPDGHFKRYFLRVPPTMLTARQAVAWTFDMPPANYSPEKET